MFIERVFSKGCLVLLFLFAFYDSACGMNVNHTSQVVKSFLNYVVDGKIEEVKHCIQNGLVDPEGRHKVTNFGDEISLGLYAFGKAVKEKRNQVAIELLKYIDMEDSNVPLEYPTASSDYRRTALTAAAYWGNKALVEHLLKLGADIDGDKLFTPLHAAIQGFYPCDRLSIISLLIDNGANIEIRSELAGSWTALDSAVFFGDSEAVKLLLDNSACFNVNEDTICHEIRPTIVHAASFYADPEGEFDASLEIIKILLSRGADINAKGCDSITALDVGVEYSNSRFVNRLLELQGDHISYETLLHSLVIAVRNGNKEMVDLLRRHDADITGLFYSPTRNGFLIACSPLLFAANGKQEEVVKYLSNRGVTALKPVAQFFSGEGRNLVRKHANLFDKHMCATSHYLEKKIGPRDLHTVIFGMVYGDTIASAFSTRLQRYRNQPKSARPYKKLKRS